MRINPFLGMVLDVVFYAITIESFSSPAAIIGFFLLFGFFFLRHLHDAVVWVKIRRISKRAAADWFATHPEDRR